MTCLTFGNTALIEVAEMKLDKTISRHDSMYNAVPNPESYFNAGESVAKAIKASLLLSGKTPTSLLDYGCGHGRITRWLKFYWPMADLSVADIREGQIQFCSEQFGAKPFLIDQPTSKIKLPGNYDIIWLGSIFTHLAKDDWTSLMHSLKRSLNEGGMLCFSFAGRTVYEFFQKDNFWGISEEEKPAAIKMVRDFEQEGFGFFEQSRSALGSWGRSIAKPEWVIQLCKYNNGKVLFYSEAAYAKRQDIISVSF